MGIPSLSLKFAVFLTFSITVSSSSSRFFLKSPSLQSRSPIPKATPSDLLSLLGPTTQSSKINPLVSQQLKRCLKFLVPFTPSLLPDPNSQYHFSSRRSLPSYSSHHIIRSCDERENELIWWPPEPIQELARLSVDSGGDPEAIHRALNPTPFPIPDVEESKENRCQLTRTPYGRRFISEELNSYLGFLFRVIVARGPSVGLDVSLNRYDFFHGHLFLATDTGRLGILFHAKEYPAYDKEVFPYNMGYCQRGSNVTYDNSMNMRNILWLAPLPSTSSKSWVAPGTLRKLNGVESPRCVGCPSGRNHLPRSYTQLCKICEDNI